MNNVYTRLYINNLEDIIAKKKQIEESHKAIVNGTTNTSNENKKEIDNRIKLINPGVEFTVKTSNVEVPSRTKIYMNSPKKNINQRRRG